MHGDELAKTVVVDAGLQRLQAVGRELKGERSVAPGCCGQREEANAGPNVNQYLPTSPHITGCTLTDWILQGASTLISYRASNLCCYAKSAAWLLQSEAFDRTHLPVGQAINKQGGSMLRHAAKWLRCGQQSTEVEGGGEGGL